MWVERKERERLRAIGMLRIHAVDKKSVGGLLNLMIAICDEMKNSP